MTERLAPPSVPLNWDGQRLLRLLDPSGDAVAWISPEDGGNTIVFALRTGNEWRQMLFIEGPEALRARPTRYGCPVLFPFPGYARDARYRWNDEVHALPINAPDGRSHVHGFAHDRPWEVVEHLDNTATLEFATRRALIPEEQGAYPFDIVVRQVVSVTDGTLEIAITAENRGETVAPVGLGLHPYVDPSFLDTDRNDISATLPGTLERVLDGPVPTGIQLTVSSPVGRLGNDGGLVCLTGLSDPATATLRGRHGRAVQMHLRGDWTDVVLFVPSDQPSVTVEPLTCSLSAASQDPDSPDSLPLLAPGQRIAGNMRLRLALPNGSPDQPALHDR